MEPLFFTLNIIVPIIAVISIIVGILLIFKIKQMEEGSDEMKKIAKAIREGANAYLKREYFYILIISIVLAVVFYFTLDFIFYGGIPFTLISFVLGCGDSILCGYIGMYIATQANIRTAYATKGGIGEGLKSAFNGGAVLGSFMMGIILLSIFGLFNIYSFIGYTDPIYLTGFGFGGSLVCIFSRVGGGIYTKSADIGADLVGKVEKGIPEDDPRNPGVIADNVGDNVGDCVGMSADLFESLSITLVVSMIISFEPEINLGLNGLYFAILVVCAGIISFIVAIFITNKISAGNNPIKALNRGLLISGIISIVLFGAFAALMLFNQGAYTGGMWHFNLPIWVGVLLSAIMGLIVAIIIAYNTQIFTSGNHKYAREIAKAGETGPATNILKGYSIGLKSIAIPGVMVAITIIFAYEFAGIYGIALSSLGLLSMTGMIQSIDTFGAISDNAGGIAEMSGQDELRKNTDVLDEAGNTTAASAKGFAIISSGLVALATVGAVIDETNITNFVNIALNSPLIIAGLFIGAIIPFLFSSLLIGAVENTAFKMINEIRRQFKEIDGLMEGKSKPDYAKCVDIATKGALKYLIIPGIMGIIVSIAVGFILGKYALIACLFGNIVVGLLMAIFLANAGGAWDNAKKWIEKGNLGGKGSPAHKAAVIGDTIGDPFKDTAGPSINSLIKVMNMISLLIAPILAVIFL
ncbi:MAG: sodium-translocating pyrophosphatase [Candidatus Helarchaeota archaeon]